VRVSLEPEIKAVMLEMLVNCFFGANIGYEQIRNRYVPALEVVIDHLTADTVLTRCGIPLHKLPAWTERLRDVREAKIAFEELTALAIAPRKRCTGLWGEFKSDVSDDALRANIRVFLAGALEATTSYASWAISHLARNPDIQTRLYNEVKDIDSYSPATLAGATFLGRVLEETLRLTPSLYFHPRRATQDTTIETTAGDTMRIPAARTSSSISGTLIVTKTTGVSPQRDSLPTSSPRTVGKNSTHSNVETSSTLALVTAPGSAPARTWDNWKSPWWSASA
jgi:cytochrome P450